MFKKLLFAIILISFTAQSQTYVKGTLDSEQNYTWVVLYQLKGAKLLYIKNATITNGEFSINFPENASAGMYRLLYNQQNQGFVDFIYNNENVQLKFDPENPFESVEFITSEENKLFTSYLFESANWQQELDAYQISYFNMEGEEEIALLQSEYSNLVTKFNTFQTEFEKKSEGKLALHFIKANHKYYSPTLIKTPQNYLNSEKKHFFDFINFEDEVLLNSIFLSELITDYVFYLNGSEDVEVQNILYKNATKEVIEKIKNIHLKSEIISTLLYAFAQVENTILVDFVIENYYNKLPENLKNKNTIIEIKEKVKLAIGKTAPEITWQENNTIKKLSELTTASNYVVVFWSTSCSHCLNEIPQLYEFIKDKKGLNVIAIALEEDEVDFNKYTSKFEKWTNILGLNKWQNPLAKAYQINATPSYFVLDKNKKIIAKPDYFSDVKVFFETY